MVFRRSLVLASLLTALAAPLVAQGADPLFGTWKLNLTKSKFEPGPLPKSQVTTFEASGKGVKIVSKVVNAEGKASTTEYVGSYDGKDFPVTGNADYDGMSMTRSDLHHVTGVRKKGGKVVQTFTRVISQDGKTYTITVTGTNAAGQKVHNVSVYDKQ